MSTDSTDWHQAHQLVLNDAACVAWQGRGLLLRGPSGAGKSDLACRLVFAGGELVADDLVCLRRDDGRLLASAPREPGLLELRGQAVLTVPCRHEVALELVVDLVPAIDQTRLPCEERTSFLGIDLRTFRLDGSAASAVARLALLLGCERRA